VHHGSVVPPIYLSDEFGIESYRQPRKYDYTRSANSDPRSAGSAWRTSKAGAGAIVTCTGLRPYADPWRAAAGARVVAPYDC